MTGHAVGDEETLRYGCRAPGLPAERDGLACREGSRAQLSRLRV